MTTDPPAREAPAAVRPPRKTARWLVPLAIVAAALIGGGLYVGRGAGMRDQALAAYAAADCATVQGLGATLAQQYDLPGLAYVADVAPAVAACTALGGAAATAQAQNYPDAVAAYDAFLANRGATPLAPRAAAERETAIFAWAASQRSAGQYAAALQTYALLARADADQARRADDAAAQTYVEWGEADLAAGRVGEAITRWKDLLATYPDNAASAAIPATIGDAYLQWEAVLAEAQSHEDLQQVYAEELDWAASRDDDALIADAQLRQASALLAWSEALRQQGDYEGAWAKNDLAARGDPAPSAAGGPAAQAVAARPALLREWAADLIKKQRYQDAIQRLRQARDLTAPADTAAIQAIDEAISQAYLGLIAFQSGASNFQAALRTVEEALTYATSDAARAAVEERRAATIDAFARSRGNEARDAMSAAMASLCGEGSMPAAPSFGLADADVRLLLSGDDAAIRRIMSANINAQSPAELHYAACASSESRIIERCPYDNGYTVHRYREYLTVSVYAISSGRRIAQQTFSGSPADACAFVESFTIGRLVKAKYGGDPDLDALVAWLKGILE